MENTLLDRYVQLVKGENWHEPFVRWSFIAYLSSLMGRKVYMRMGTDYEYPTIYVILVGPPSSKKTSTAKAPKELFYRHQQNRQIIAADVMTPAAWIEELKDAEDKIGKADLHSPLYIMSKEFSTVLRDIGGGSPLDLLLSFYDSRAPGEVFRKRTIGSGVVEVLNPAVTILGCTTPDGLRDSGILRAGNTGFISRFIVVAHRKHVNGSFRRPSISDRECNLMAMELDEIANIRGEMLMDESAIEEAGKIYEEINAKQQDVLSNAASEYFGRKLTQIYKVSMIFAALRKSRVIVRSDIVKAYDEITALEPTMSYMLKPQTQFQDPDLPSKITEALETYSAPISEGELLHFLNRQGVISKDDFYDGILRSMLESDIIRVTIQNGVPHFVKGKNFNGQS